MSENTLYLVEILQMAQKAKSDSEAVAILKKHQTPSLHRFFEATYHAAVKWELPVGEPPYTPDKNPLGNNASSLTTEILGVFRFLNSGNKIPGEIKREQIFIQTLESLNHIEAKALLAAKERNLVKMFPRLSHSFVLSVFPGLYQTAPIVPEHAIPEVKKSPLVDGGISSGSDIPVVVKIRQKPGPKPKVKVA